MKRKGKSRMKRILCLAIAITMIFGVLLAGCGVKTEEASGNTAATAAEPSAAETEPVAASSDEPVTLTYLSWHNETTLKPLIEAFNAKYPNIKIDLQYAPPINDYVEKAKVLFLAGETPDIFVTAAENKREVIDNGYALDISALPVLAKTGDTFKNTYAKDGKVYAFAPDCWIGGLYYNKKLFEKAGATAPTNYSEFLDALKKLKASGVKPISFCKDNLYDMPQGLFITETISKNFNYDTEVNEGKRTYAEGWTKPYQMWYDDFIKTGYVTKDMLGITAEQAVDEFTTEKSAILVGGTWSIATFKEKNPDLQFDMMPFVGTDGAKWNIGAVGVGFSVGANSKHQKEAMQYMEFFTSDEGLKIFQAQTGGVLGVDGIDYELHPVIAQFKESAVAGKFYLPAVAWKYSDAMGQIMSKGSQDILGGVAKPEEIPQQMDDKFKELSQAQ
jgi:raffinose/stachyose/melibiose transport system substrate-binding protein